MQLTTMSWFRTISQFILVTFFLSLFHPASLRVPWSLDLHVRITDTGSLALTSPLFSLELGPPSVHGQIISTPEADTSDAFVVAKVAELNSDPNAIFQFVRSEIGYEAYQGSLRGARGTLWSSAGNALDQASLLIAMFGAANFEARYVQSSLSTPQAQEVILSMFPPVLRIVGCPPENAERADPANDPQLLAEAKEHYYVEVNLGGGFVPADPILGNAIGDAPAPNLGTFAEVPDNLRHKVTVRLIAEHSTAFSPMPERTTVLAETFVSAFLVGRPLSIGHFVNSSETGGLVGGSITHTYAPYVLIGESDGDITDDEIIRGTDYQEVFSGLFPIANQTLTGIFLEMDVQSSNGTIETFEREILDRIGFAERQNGAGGTLPNISVEEPALTDFDMVTINALSGLQSLAAIGTQEERLTPPQERLNDLQPVIATFPPEGPLTQEQQTLFDEAVNTAREVTLVTAETIATAFAGASDESLAQLEKGYLTKGYYVSPRLILVLTRGEGEDLSAKIDLQKNNLRAVPFPGQIPNVTFDFEVARGLMESTLEGTVLSMVIGQPAISIADIFQQLEENEIALLDEENLQSLENLQISETAKARITQAARSGKSILTPTRMLSLNGKTTIGWFETDKVTGQTISVMEDGGHPALVEYSAFRKIVFAGPVSKNLFRLIGTLHGFGAGILIFLGVFIGAINSGQPFAEAVKSAKKAIGLVSQKILIELKLFLLLPRVKPAVKAFNKGFEEGIELAKNWINRNLPVDPPVFPFLSSDLGDGPAPIPPGAQPGVTVHLIPDEFFTVEVGGAELPSVFLTQIQNTGPTEDTFAIVLPNPPPGYTLESSVSEITVPPGQTAEVGICLRPINGLGAPGTAAPFDVTVTSTTDPSITDTTNENFVTPDVHGLTLTPAPTFTSTSPVSSVPVELSMTAAGNVAEQVTLSGNVPSGVTINGLPANVSLAQGETQTFPLTLNVGAGVPLNETLSVTITAELAGAPDLEPSTTIQLSIRSAEVVLVEQSAIKAGEANNTQLAQILSNLSDTFAQLQADPADSRLCSRAQLQLTNLHDLFQVNPNLTLLIADLQAVRDAAASCDVAGMLALVPGFFADVEAALNSVVASQALLLALSPASVNLEPGEDTNLTVILENQGSTSRSLALSVGVLPNSVSATLSQTNVTVAPGEVVDENSATPITLSLVQSLTSTEIFSVSITATDTTLSQTASAHVAVRSALADVVSVTADPTVVEAGDSINVKAMIQNSANTPQSIVAVIETQDLMGAGIGTPTEVPINLNPSIEPIDVDLGQIDTAGLPDGLYRVQVALQTTNGTHLPGRSAQTLFFVGSPVSATVRTEPAFVVPGSPESSTIIEVTNLTALEAGSSPPMDQLTPGLEWSWTSSAILPDSLNVMNTPAVADLNADGIPDIIFGSTRFTFGNGLSGNLRALSGDTGAELFTVLDHTIGTECSVAVGDIDLDGRPEIVACASSSLVAFEHDGTFKWQSERLEIPTRWGAPALADLDQDGTPEIVFGRQVLNNDGTIRWTGSGGILVSLDSLLSLVADVNLDGRPDVIAGNTVYEASGAILWQASQLSGYKAVANFDADPFPEIVSVRDGSVHLLEHDGSLKWGPVSIPGSGGGGPPTIADYDGDGEPEIGVAGEERYAVFETDGSLKWEAITQDATSGVTGSSVFDFEGDGSAEVIYRDELMLRVYRGTDGAVLFETPISSCTWHEYVLVADVDADKSAEIVAVANNNCDIGPQRGVFVFGNPEWVSTRQVWNQHTYHITNVDEDGTIPTVEQNNWEVSGLNNYRLNTFAPGDRGAVDMTIAVRHHLPTSGYDVDQASITPPADSVSIPEIVWSGQIPFNSPTPLPFELTGLIPDIAPGETRDMSIGTEVIATFTNSDGQQVSTTITLPPVAVTAVHILDLEPASQTVERAAGTTYDVLITNPLDTSETFTLRTIGLNGLDVTLAPSVTVPPGQTVTETLTVGVPAGFPEGNRIFSVQAETATGGSDTVDGQLVIQGGDPGSSGGSDPPPEISLGELALDIAIKPVQPIAGQGTPATYQVIVTNVGSETDTYTLSGAFPASFTGAFATTSVEVPPGLGNFREVVLTITPPPNTTPGDFSFTVTATSTSDGAVSDDATGTGTVVGNGVQVALSPASGGPGTTFEMMVTNTGRVADTFTLSLGGPGAVFATLETETLSLGINEVGIVPIPTTAVDSALPGTLALTAVATSQGNTAIHDHDTATLTIAAVQALDAEMDPPMQELSAPDPASFLVVIDNIGNIEDAYMAEITTTTGPVTASLNGLDNQPAQSVPLFRLPGTTTGALLLNTDLTANGQGTVSVKVTSLSDPAITDTTTATVQTENTPPVADAGQDQNAETGMDAVLDGSNSFDPEGEMITFAWSFVSVPNGSQLTEADIIGRDTPTPRFSPDVAGEYVVQLIVEDARGLASAPDEVIVTATDPNVPPNADAGDDQTGVIGVQTDVDGSNSVDPDNGPNALTFAWRFTAVPADSQLTDADITGATTAQASFVPDVSGVFEMELRVSDGEDTDTDIVVITVQVPNVPPNADAGDDQTVQVGDLVVLDGTQSTDPDAGPEPLTFTWRFVSVPPGSSLSNADIEAADQAVASFSPDVEGYYVLELEVFDGQASDFDNVMIGVTCVDGVTANPDELWPPNHRMVAVTVEVGAAACSTGPACQIVTVQSNEPVNGLGDGNALPDWEITGALSVDLRAERSGLGDGRIYTIEVMCEDGVSTPTVHTTTVTVPHSRGGGGRR